MKLEFKWIYFFLIFISLFDSSTIYFRLIIYLFILYYIQSSFKDKSSFYFLHSCFNKYSKWTSLQKKWMLCPSSTTRKSPIWAIFSVCLDLVIFAFRRWQFQKIIFHLILIFILSRRCKQNGRQCYVWVSASRLLAVSRWDHSLGGRLGHHSSIRRDM